MRLKVKKAMRNVILNLVLAVLIVLGIYANFSGRMRLPFVRERMEGTVRSANIRQVQVIDISDSLKVVKQFSLVLDVWNPRNSEVRRFEWNNLGLNKAISISSQLQNGVLVSFDYSETDSNPVFRVTDDRQYSWQAAREHLSEQ